VPANFQRFLPILLIGFFLLFVLPTLIHHSSKGKSNTLSSQTLQTSNLVDAAEKSYKAAHKRYTENIADLLVVDRKIGSLLGNGIGVSLNTSSNGDTYFSQVTSSVITYIRARTGSKLITHSCLVIKSANGVSCPKPPVKSTTSTITTTTTSTAQ
jgi:hypothetical protein